MSIIGFRSSPVTGTLPARSSGSIFGMHRISPFLSKPSRPQFRFVSHARSCFLMDPFQGKASLLSKGVWTRRSFSLSEGMAKIGPRMAAGEPVLTSPSWIFAPLVPFTSLGNETSEEASPGPRALSLKEIFLLHSLKGSPCGTREIFEYLRSRNLPLSSVDVYPKLHALQTKGFVQIDKKGEMRKSPLVVSLTPQGVSVVEETRADAEAVSTIFPEMVQCRGDIIFLVLGVLAGGSSTKGEILRRIQSRLPAHVPSLSAVDSQITYLRLHSGLVEPVPPVKTWRGPSVFYRLTENGEKLMNVRLFKKLLLPPVENENRPSSPNPQPSSFIQGGDYSTLTRVGNYSDLMKGAYEGLAMLGGWKEEAKFNPLTQGLGTFSQLDGEMVILNGTVYQVKPDGQVLIIEDPSTLISFGLAVCFSPTREIHFGSMSYGHLVEGLHRFLSSSEKMAYALRVEGLFDRLVFRSLARQSPPYRPFPEIASQAPRFECGDPLRASLVGFFTPESWGSTTGSGPHLHGLNESKSMGGHVLDFQAIDIDVFAAPISQIHLFPPAS